MIWLVIASVLLAVVGAYYNLRVIKLMYFGDATEHSPIRAGWDVQALIGFNALLPVGVLPWVGRDHGAVPAGDKNIGVNLWLCTTKTPKGAFVFLSEMNSRVS
jgi:hypothetical protein